MLCADTDRGARAKLPSRRTYLADDTNMPGTQSHQPLPRTVDDVDSDDDYDIQVRKRLQQGTGHRPVVVSDDDDEEENVPPPKRSPRQSSVSDGIACSTVYRLYCLLSDALKSWTKCWFCSFWWISSFWSSAEFLSNAALHFLQKFYLLCQGGCVFIGVVGSQDYTKTTRTDLHKVWYPVRVPGL